LLQVPLPLKESVFFHGDAPPHHREIVHVNFKTRTAAARIWAVFGTLGLAAEAATV
jgi:hypothetical protein